MEIRTLKYFLAVAQEGNISKAANVLHITQPTLSRQIKAFEDKLGTVLFDRDNNMELTDAGLLLKDRAQEIIHLANQTEREFENQKNILFNGNISFGIIEGTGSTIFSQLVESFQEKYPGATYDIFTGTGDDISDRIDKGLINIGFLIEPINTNKYNIIPLKNPEAWGVLIHRDHPLSQLKALEPNDLIEEPLFLSARTPVIRKITKWFNKDIEELIIKGHYNLLSNMALLVEKKIGIAIVTEAAGLKYQTEETKFIPLKSASKSDSILAWKKERVLTPTVEEFIKHSKQIISQK